MAEKVGIFIDAGYVRHVLKHEFKQARIDYGKLAESLVKSCGPEATILRTYFYDCEPYQGEPPTQEESKRLADSQRFHEALRRIPFFEVRLGKLVRRGIDKGSGKPFLEQKQVDVYMATDILMLSLKRAVNHVVLITGDSDFIPVVKVARDEGVQITLVHGGRPARRLQSAVDKNLQLDSKFIKKIRL